MDAVPVKHFIILVALTLPACQQPPVEDLKRKYLEEAKKTNPAWESYALFAKPSDTCGEVQVTFKTYTATGQVCCDEANQKCRLAWRSVSQGC